MALNLLINGHVLSVDQVEPFSTPDAVAETLGRRAARERAEAREERDPAGVLRNMQRSIILALMESGRLKPVQARAGAEVALVYEAVTCVVAARTARYGETGCQGLSNADWPPSLKAASQRYSAWAEWANRQAINPRYSLVELVQDVAIDGWGLSQVRRRRGIDERTALRWLQRGLWRYAVMAGWAEEAHQAA